MFLQMLIWSKKFFGISLLMSTFISKHPSWNLSHELKFSAIRSAHFFNNICLHLKVLHLSSKNTLMVIVFRACGYPHFILHIFRNSSCLYLLSSSFIQISIRIFYIHQLLKKWHNIIIILEGEKSKQSKFSRSFFLSKLDQEYIKRIF